MSKNIGKVLGLIFTISTLLIFGCGGGGGGGGGGGNSGGCGIIKGEGEPDIWFTEVSPYGDYYGTAKGRVVHVVPGNVKVAVYIYVNGGWWTKPYWAWPVTDVKCNGKYVTDITTGGIDEYATEIIAYLIPEDYDPPLAYGGALPSVELEAHALTDPAIEYR